MTENRDTRRRFEQWASNPRCVANTVSAVHGISMAQVVKSEGGEPTFGQSPFALMRGQSFERRLFANDAQSLREALAKARVLPTPEATFRDFRLRRMGGPCADLDQARLLTARFFAQIAEGKADAKLPLVAAGATVSIPGGVMLPEAMLIIDALVARRDDGYPTLIVGEVKTYPDRAGYTAASELATTRAQAGVYVHGLRLVLQELALDKRIAVSSRGFLVLTRPGYNIPSIRADEDLQYQARRAERGFAKLRIIAALKVPAPPGNDAARLQAVSDADVEYSEECVSFCDRAPLCHAKAMKAGDPAVLGSDMVRFLGETDLYRAVELLGGAKARTPAEGDLKRRLKEADITGSATR